MLPIKDAARARILDVVRVLKPYIPEATANWRAKMFDELQLDGRVMAALERLNIGTGFTLFCRMDFTAFFESLAYFGTRLSKLKVDTRLVARSLETYQSCCEKFLSELPPIARAEGITALETFTSSIFVAVSGLYFDAQQTESAALLAVLEAELSATSLSVLLLRILEVTTKTYDATIGFVMLRDTTGQLSPMAQIGFDNGELGEEHPVPVGMGFAEEIAKSGQPGILPDLSTTTATVSPILKSKAHAIWGVPLKIEEQVIGVLVIGFQKPYEWLPTERELMRAIAERSAMAIERARMMDALRERETRIAELSAHLLRAQEEERKRISRELHDATGQQLMVIRLYLGMVDGSPDIATMKTKIQETVGVVDQTIDGIRRIIAKLSPLVLQELGLIPAIKKEAKEFTKRFGIKTRVTASDSIGRLGADTEAAIYRVVQEALHNAGKHSKAKLATVQVTRQEGSISLIIQDDGVGIEKGPELGRNFGLAGMRERVGMLGGTVIVVSAKNQGTRIEVKVPVGQAPARGRSGAHPIPTRPFIVRKVVGSDQII